MCIRDSLFTTGKNSEGGRFRSISLTALDTSNVNNMSGMLASSGNLTSIELGDKFDTSEVTDMSGMFKGYSVSVK